MRHERVTPPMPASEAASKRMRSNRSRDTSPEVALQTELYRGGCDSELITGLR